MKKSRFLEIIRDEIKKELREYGSESMYYNSPSGFEQVKYVPQLRMQRFNNLEKWKIVAMQMGATIQDRGNDWIAIMPNQDKIGTYGKLNDFGTLELYS